MINLEVDCLHRGRSIAVLSDGQEIPIVSWFGPGALPVNPDDALSCVAGPDFDGQWYAIALGEFTGAIIN